ncbi:uncharacterized protein C8A04DRAFT_37554 [Dichotomopilus funicola]|uniref:Uncharacterized protein n=1 Tax=Dichotomopilus funicola TaxID=1934379 RepID=A0AAN6ZN98_9PEZI|nr:hypothetical protein C8A04DRAFT_37554 [Dichotomopilus funicola]
MKYLASFLLASGLAAAQSTSVVDILLPFGEQTLLASVISAAPTATTYLLACPSGADSNDCGVPSEGVEIFYGPSTFGYTLSDTGKLSASCNALIISGKTTATQLEPLTGYTEYIFPITITAGFDKLSAGAGAAPTNTPASTTASAPTTRPTGATNSQGGGGASDGASSTSSSTGGMPRVTQNAVIMGAAALVGGAMLI